MTMGTKIRLKASDGHELDAYFAESNGPAHGAIVLVQEIFGVNSHIRSVADDYASQGYHVVAPALFDRVQPNLELGYNPADTAQGMKAARQIGMDAALHDVAASIAHARTEWPALKVGVLGFCYGAVWRGLPLRVSIRPPQFAITVGRLRRPPWRFLAVP
jgi:carboxymethylenebutenolidase